MSSLKQLAIRGTIWTFIGYGSSQVLRLGSNLILTRLLVPEVFGLMALVNTFIMGLSLFSDVGINPSIIQNPRGEKPEFYNTAWTLQVIRGIGIWITCIIIAYPISVFYDTPELKWLIPALGLNSIISGFQSTSLPLIKKKVKVSISTSFMLGVQLVYLGLIILFVWFYRSIWSLVIASIISQIVSTIVSHKLMPEIKNRFTWNQESLKELFSFGKWIFVSTAISFFAMQCDRLLLGRLFPIEILGIYTIAFTFADIPIQVINRINGSVVFPLVSQLSDLSRQELRKKIIDKRKLILILGITLVVLLTCFGDLLVLNLYDERYKDGAWMLQILALGIWPNLLSITMRSVQLGIGKPMYGAYGYLLKFIYMVIMLPFITNIMGLFGAILVIAFNDIPFYLAVQYGLWKEQLLTVKQDFWATLFLVFLISIILFIRYYLGLNLTLPSNGFFD
ncbi:oligosaccharide flippase family protein [Cyanobacterium aponinum UTEX 3222]|uniref:Oligosaccharide flippase family protein n=1 Tax=Cyanobacterium aponinum 0216 TaxID=2676140 RepID=A0A844GRL9_9CHRO|nr:oligosaccharide flippase family protein [Cyanobacterium aponinum]MTF38600.1 oligosaccharide flippase family protein [Cyanobacterium aponinum 0216]WRL42058.1 oligosaccharide flippase family protein [Cyanobacterium aponinum UTEX 3222]